MQELVRHLTFGIVGYGSGFQVLVEGRSGAMIELKVGDVVIVMSTDTPRGKWPLGRIVKLLPGKDNKVFIELLTSKLKGLCFGDQL